MEIRRADKIADTLVQMVFARHYADGERLDEVKLAQKFEVSRTPVREALQVLVSSGLAEQIPRRGVFVRQPGPVELMDMFETMAELEAACGRLAAGRMSDDTVHELSTANDACQSALEAVDVDRYHIANERFHQVIYHGSGNAYLETQTLHLQNRLSAYRKMQLRFRGRLSQSMDEHSQIVAGIRQGDAETVGRVLRSHVAVQGEKFHQMIVQLNT